jgi:hypothetical protein
MNLLVKVTTLLLAFWPKSINYSNLPFTTYNKSTILDSMQTQSFKFVKRHLISNNSPFFKTVFPVVLGCTVTVLRCFLLRPSHLWCLSRCPFPSKERLVIGYCFLCSHIVLLCNTDYLTQLLYRLNQIK